MALTSAELNTLQEGLVDAGRQIWSSCTFSDDHDPIFVASDSSGWRWAFVSWSQRRGSADDTLSDASDWNRSMDQASIFLKELTCATIAIERICKAVRSRRIVLFCDNTAACQVMKRLASLQRILTVLSRQRNRH